MREGAHRRRADPHRHPASMFTRGYRRETGAGHRPPLNREGTEMQVHELRPGFVVRPAGSKEHTRYRTVGGVYPGDEPGTVYVSWRGEGGRTQRVKSDAEFETQPETLPVLRTTRTTITRYDLRQAVQVVVYSGRGRGPEVIETNCVRVSCENAKSTIEVWTGPLEHSGENVSIAGGWKQPTEDEHKRLAKALGVKC